MGIHNSFEHVEAVGRPSATVTSNSSSKTRGTAAPGTRSTWASFVGSEEPSLKILRSVELLRTNSSPISNCWHLKSAIFLSRNINYNTNSLLWLHVGPRIIYLSIYLSIYLYIYIYIYIYISDECYIPEVEMKTI